MLFFEEKRPVSSEKETRTNHQNHLNIEIDRVYVQFERETNQ